MSDYGDDDFDDDTFMELEASMAVASQSQCRDAEAHLQTPAPARGRASAREEFGDLDDAIFDGADAFRATTTSQIQTAIVKPGKSDPSQELTLSDDEFADEFDADIDLEAIELAATQAVNEAAASTPAVCSTTKSNETLAKVR